MTFKTGTSVRVIGAGYVSCRGIQPVVGTVGEVIDCPVYSPSPEQESFIWVQFEKPPAGLLAMDGTLWLRDEYNPERDSLRIGYDSHMLEDASLPSSVAGFEEALCQAWEEERTRARESYYAESRRLHEKLLTAIVPNMDVVEWEQAKADSDANYEAGFEAHFDWARVRMAAGLDGAVPQLLHLLADSGLTVKFGLAAQGHIPTIEKLLSRGASWGEIGKEVGWCPDAAERYYYLETLNTEQGK